MPVYKDGNSGTWRAQFYYIDWTGKKHKKNKRGFKTKKEAQQFESEYIRVAKADMDMKLSSFVEIYLKDKEVELKQRTLRNKGYMIDTHVIPYLGDKKMNEITPADIIAWQKEIKEKNDFSESYKVLHYDKFLNVKGLVEEFKEFARPKSIKERMEDKLKNVKTQKQEMKPVQRRKKDLAI